MKRMLITLTALMALFMTGATAGADVIRYDRAVDYGSYLRYDPYLSVEVWTDDDEYYDGENIQISFRADEDCFVVVYNIDSRGDVNLLYPVDLNDDMKIEGGRIYHIPDSQDDYELTVRGPEGIEYIQIVASRERIPLPDWVDGSGLYCDDDPFDFMEYINASYFGCDYGCRRAYDLASFVVNEWNEAYFRPVYVYDTPHWSMCGSVFVDYPFGASIYIDGIYWGCAPLYIPRIYYGYHWVTVYDPWGYCWEDRITVVRRRSVIVDETIVRTKVNVKSRYRDVRKRGYLNPVDHGYPGYEKQVAVKKEIRKTMTTSASRYSGSKLTKSSSRSTGSRYTTGSSRTRGSSYNRDKLSTSSRRKSSASDSRSSSSMRSSGKSSGSKSSTRSRSTTMDRKSSSSKTSSSSKSSKNSRNSSSVRKSSRSSKSSGSAQPQSSSSRSGSSSVKSSSRSGNSATSSASRTSTSRTQSSGSSKTKPRK